MSDEDTALPRPPSLELPRFDPRERLEERWFAALFVAAAAVQVSALARFFARVPADQRPPLLDSIIFEYVGWYITTGARLYVDVWELKPPLAYELPALLALLAGGNVTVYHGLAVLVTNAAVVGIALLVGTLVHDLTGDGLASVLAGLAPYALATVYWRAAFGFKAKYFVVLFGLLAILLALRGRPLSAGAAAGASLGTWQLGLIFPLIAVGLAAERGRAAAARTVAGAAGALLIVLLPVVAWNAVGAMIAETVLTPLLVESDGTLLRRWRLVNRGLGIFGHAVVVVGIYGIVATALGERRRADWWVPVGATWFIAQIALLDMDTLPDLIPVMAFVGLGVGIAVGRAGGGRPLVALLLVAVVTSVVNPGGPFPTVQAHGVPTSMSLAPPYGNAERRFLFWGSVEPTTCRVFAGPTQARVMELVGGWYTDPTCGDLEATWRALLAKYGLA